MKSVIVTANDYGELRLIHTARRLYQRIESATSHKQDLAKRFAIGFRMIVDKFHSDVMQSDPQHGTVCSRACRYNTLPEEIKAAIKRLEEYQNLLDDWGLKDYQVHSLDSIDPNALLYTFAHAFTILVLASIPTLVLNAPVGLAASFYAQKEAKKDLAASRVKLAARDVLLSKKIVFSIVAVPLLLLTYGLLLRILTSWETRTIVVLMLTCPLFSYLGVISMQAGMVDLKDLRPAFLRLMPGFKTQTQRLPAMRAELQQEVRRLIHKYGEQLGPLYTDQSLDLVAFGSSAATGAVAKSKEGAASTSRSSQGATASGSASSNPVEEVRAATTASVSGADGSSSASQEGRRAESGDFGLATLPVMPEFENEEEEEGKEQEAKKTR
jgi:glycerol-3-phosphate O-acyltransferase/dihydroxyacetone phosphate acyltransferase